MTERPIIFSGPMVRAIQGGTKSQTRRVVKPQPGAYLGYMMGYSKQYAIQCGADYPDDASDRVKCPYGVPGDRLWVKENHHWFGRDRGFGPEGGFEYCADGKQRRFEEFNAPAWTIFLDKWRAGKCNRTAPSIYMPRWASRINLEITDIRVQRVQEISEEDARAEGVELQDAALGWARMAFRDLWDSINAKRGFGWDVNPFCWVVGFRRIL